MKKKRKRLLPPRLWYVRDVWLRNPEPMLVFLPLLERLAHYVIFRHRVGAPWSERVAGDRVPARWGDRPLVDDDAEESAG